MSLTFGDIVLDNNATINTNMTDDEVTQEQYHYNILLWTPFVIIPSAIIAARIIKYLYRIYQARKYGYGITSIYMLIIFFFFFKKTKDTQSKI